MDNERRARRGWAKWVGLVFCAMIATHVIVEVVTAGQTVITLRNGWEIGSNGFAVHAMWTSGDSPTALGDHESSSLRWVDSDDLFYCRVPLLAPFLVAALWTAILFRRERVPANTNSWSKSVW